MAENIIQQYYDQRGFGYGMNKLRKKKILELVLEEGIENKRILDLGCATGFFSKDLKKENNIVIGIDISEKLIDEAKKVLDEAYAMDIENNDWPKQLIENPFDIIICSELIEHLFDQESFLKKVRLVLKPNGKIIFTTPNFLIWNNRIKMLLGRYGLKEVFNDRSHIHLLSYKGLIAMISQAGFWVVGESHVWYPNWLEKFHKLIPPSLFVYQAIIKVQPHETHTR